MSIPPRNQARRHLDFADWISESAIAVYMVIIVNGYVALSQLNTGYLYIIAVDLGACVAWGFIDGFAYAIGGSVEKGNQASFLKRIQSETDPNKAMGLVAGEFDGTFLGAFSTEGKRAIAREILKNSVDVSTPGEGSFISREDALGLLSILSIYVSAGIVMSLPYVVLPDKLNAWFISDIIALALLFSYGFRVGEIVHKPRVLIGLVTAGLGVAFLLVSYSIFSGIP